MSFRSTSSYHVTDENVDPSIIGFVSKHAAVNSSSRHGSPTPMPQTNRTALPPMSPLPFNRRSVSRVSSRGDETPLGSPMPVYPRRRSVSFVGERCASIDMEDDDGDREERPYYHTSTVDSAPRQASRSQRSRADAFAEDTQPQVVPTPSIPSIMVKQPQYDSDTSRLARLNPTPKKQLMTPIRRSASRQRLEARRQQAQLDHTFYDDSFVEEYIAETKEDIARREAEERRQAEAELQRQRQEMHAAKMQLQQRSDNNDNTDVNDSSHGRTQTNISTGSISQISNNGPSEASFDHRAVLTRLLKEFSALEGKPYIVDTPVRKSQKMTQHQQQVAAEHEDHYSQVQKRAEEQQHSNAVKKSQALTTKNEHHKGKQPTPQQQQRVEPPQQQQPRKAPRKAKEVPPSPSTSSNDDADNDDGEMDVLSEEEEEDARMEKLIRETMAKYRDAKRKSKRSVTLIDADAAADEHRSDIYQGGKMKSKSRPETAATANNRGRRDASQPVAIRKVIDSGEGRKRARSANREPSSRRRQDSRPQFDDESSDDNADHDSLREESRERPILLSRTSTQKRPAVADGVSSGRGASRGRRIEADVDAILGINNNPPPVMLPRAEPPQPKKRGGRKAPAKSQQQPIQVEIVQETRQLPVASFTAPYVEPTFTRPVVATAAIMTSAPSRGPAKSAKGVDPNDPFAQFFDLQFDSPGKFDESKSSATSGRRSNNGGLVLASTCRSRKK